MLSQAFLTLFWQFLLYFLTWKKKNLWTVWATLFPEGAIEWCPRRNLNARPVWIIQRPVKISITSHKIEIRNRKLFYYQTNWSAYRSRIFMLFLVGYFKYTVDNIWYAIVFSLSDIFHLTILVANPRCIFIYLFIYCACDILICTDELSSKKVEATENAKQRETARWGCKAVKE